MKNEQDIFDIAIGIYAINAFLLLCYIIFSLIEDAYVIAEIWTLIGIAWFWYSVRIINKYAKIQYSANYMANFILCSIICLICYMILPLKTRVIVVFLVSSEGVVRTFFVEIWRLIKKSKEEENEKNNNIGE